ncbi:FAD/NAD(P)-binding domain-containing protein [Corynespora cassiicola Philippines]|uniref:FAD/NAD(P)-binding domain-containing protein n=1 Tax=Corynespora cassiicola Philippines TaxID=1448308 RepID=A0A2T2NQC9_CORCC|nr:FAD/NAD(P)-binding domain-containing protein [Corynespora cassiicola Philippines]
MTEVLDLRKDAVFNARVNEVKHDSSSNLWSFHTEDGLVAQSKYAVFAAGTTNKAYIPSFPGLDGFQGTVIHPAAWPANLDIKGKKVGLVGQGASGLQILQEIGKEDCEVTVFVRNPPTALPMVQRTISELEAEEAKNSYDALFTFAKNTTNTAYSHNTAKDSFYDATPEERQKLYETLWKRGSYATLSCGYPEVQFDKAANSEYYQFWAAKSRARITDPVKRDIMVPLEQFQWIGTKRPNLEMDYYEVIDRPNVKLVSLKSNEIKGFTERSIITGGADGEQSHDLDIVIFATGYDSVTGSLYDMNIHDKNGLTLQEKWKNGLSTWLGMMVPDLPNAFMLYGPQAPSGLANGPPFLEMQVEWVADFLKKLKDEDVKTVEVSSDAAKAYREFNLHVYSMLLMRETKSWWNGSNIPGKVNEPLFWTAGIQAWKQQANKGLEDWSSLILEKK